MGSHTRTWRASPCGSQGLDRPPTSSRYPAGSGDVEGNDVDPLLDDIRGRSERDALGSDLSPPLTTTYALTDACFRSEKPESSLSDMNGERHEELASFRELLGEHLAEVRAIVDDSLARLVRDLRDLDAAFELRAEERIAEARERAPAIEEAEE